MKVLLALGLATLALMGNSRTSVTQESTILPTPSCAWQFEWTPFGIGNWFWAATANRWWYMPVDPQWRTVTITGRPYPTFPQVSSIMHHAERDLRYARHASGGHTRSRTERTASPPAR